MAKSFGIRIEMRQIGYRQEAQRLGGIGSCGRELCCSTWLTDFRSVSTSAARYQQLSLNPQKLAGQCGKLKCCLNYELDIYLDALKDFPASDTKIITEKGVALCQKVDIFKATLWFCYKDDWANWHALSKEHVNEMLEKNKRNEKVSSLEEYAIEESEEKEQEKVFENVVGQDSLTRFDKPKQPKNNRNKKRSPNKKPQQNAGTAATPEAKQNSPANNPNQKAKPSRNKPRKPRPAKTADTEGKPSAQINQNPPNPEGTAQKRNNNKRRTNNKKRPTDNDNG